MYKNTLISERPEKQSKRSEYLHRNNSQASDLNTSDASRNNCDNYSKVKEKHSSTSYFTKPREKESSTSNTYSVYSKRHQQVIS